MATQLDDILKDAPTTEEAPKEETPPEEAKDETGEEAKTEESEEKPEETKEEEKAEPPSAEDKTKEQAGLITALMDERGKRQALQKENEDLKAKGEPEKDFFEDPEGHMAKLKEELQTDTTNRFVDLTVDLARKTHEDFNEVMEGWKDVVDANPAILNQVMTSGNPGEESYRIAKQYRDMQEIGDPAAYKAKLKEEIKADVLKELKESGNTQVLPESLAEERNVGERKGPAFSGPTPLSEVLGQK